jgi:hypothetical protein
MTREYEKKRAERKTDERKKTKVINEVSNKIKKKAHRELGT